MNVVGFVSSLILIMGVGVVVVVVEVVVVVVVDVIVGGGFTVSAFVAVVVGLVLVVFSVLAIVGVVSGVGVDMTALQQYYQLFNAMQSNIMPGNAKMRFTVKRVRRERNASLAVA